MKPQWNDTAHVLEFLKCKKYNIPSVGKKVGLLELS